MIFYELTVFTSNISKQFMMSFDTYVTLYLRKQLNNYLLKLCAYSKSVSRFTVYMVLKTNDTQ
jgi:hypothetical protein